MAVQMYVILADMQPDARTHENCCKQQRSRRWRAQGYGQRGTDEGRQREISASPRSTEIAQRYDEKRQA